MPKTINQDTEAVALNRLKLHPRNANRGDVDAISESIETNGFFGTIVANKRTGHILIGNHRYQVAKAQGFDSIPVTWVDVDDETELRILLADNRTARLGKDDETQLAELLSELSASDTGLIGTGFKDADLEQLLDDLANAGDKAGTAELLTDPDEIPTDAPTRCNVGDLWQLGRHRLLCGDSTKNEDVSRLMDGKAADIVFTDPPYGIAYTPKASASDGKTISPARKKMAGVLITNDADPLRALEVIGNALCLHKRTAAFFVCCDWRSMPIIADAMKSSGIAIKSCIVWDKGGPYQHLDRFAKGHEFILYAGPYGGQKTFSTDVWKFPREFRDDHPTPKPVALIANAISAASADGDIVVDCFLGSGSTLIAAEQTGRICYGMELEPKYCDVILARWEAATGQTATFLQSENG